MRRLALLTVVAGCLIPAGCQAPFARMATRDDRAPQLKNARRKDTWVDARLAGDRSTRDEDPAKSATAEGRLEQAHAAARAGRLAEAKSLYRDVLAEDPNHPEARHGLAVIADRERDFRAAEEHYLTALRSRPGDPDLLNDLGYSYFVQQRYSEGERYLTRALQTDPSHRLAANNLGQLYAAQGRHADALEMFRRVGTEAEARAQLARFSQPHGETDALAARDARGAPDDRGSFGAPDPLKLPPDASAEDVQRLMAEARRRSIAARARRNGERPPTAITPAERATPQPQRGQPLDQQLNDQFAKIDRGERTRPRPAALPQRPRSDQPPVTDWPVRQASAESPAESAPVITPHRRESAARSDSDRPWPATPPRNVEVARAQEAPSLRAPAPVAGERGVMPRDWHAQPAAVPGDRFGGSGAAPRMRPSSPHGEAARLGMDAGPGVMMPLVGESGDSAPAGTGGPSAGARGPAGAQVPPWPNAPPDSVAPPSAASFAQSHESLYRTPSRTRPRLPQPEYPPGHDSALQRAGAAEAYQAEIERHQRKLRQLEQQLRTERRLPAAGGPLRQVGPPTRGTERARRPTSPWGGATASPRND